jgi:hypothetical protein
MKIQFPHTVLNVAFKTRNIISVFNKPNLADASNHPDNDNSVYKEFPHKWHLQRESRLWKFIYANVWAVILVPSNKGRPPAIRRNCVSIYEHMKIPSLI